MHELAPLIRDLAIMMVVAGIVTVFFRKIHQPVVLGYLIAGIIIGPYTPPGLLITDLTNIKIISELGVIFLLFFLGLEFSFHKLTRVGFSASITGLFEVVLMIVLGFITGKCLGWSIYDSLFLGAAIAISSSTIIVKAIEELGLTKKRFAELTFGISIVDDLLAILLLVFLTTLVTKQTLFLLGIISATGKLLLVVVSWFVVGYFFIPTLYRRIMQYASDETITIVSVGLCLLMVNVAAYFNYSVALGAFIMGSILAETPLIQRIQQLIKPIRDVFAAIFFISVGILINPIIIFQHWPIVLFITLITIFGKLIGNGLGAFLTGQSLNTSIRTGFSMAQIGEFSFIIVGLGAALNVTSNVLYPIIVAVSAITTFTTPYLIRFSGPLANALESHLSERAKFTLDAYSDSIYRFLSRSKLKLIYRRALIRLLINGIMVIIIFTLIKKMLLPEIIVFIKPWVSQIISWLIAIVLSSPFLWGMLFSYKTKKSLKNKINLNFLSFIVWLITIVMVATLSVTYFYNWFVIGIVFLIVGLIFLIFYTRMEKIYYWFEKQLVENIKKKDIHYERYKALAPWDTHLVEIRVGEFGTSSWKTLQESQLNEKFKINIVAILRGAKTIILPEPDEKIYPQDKLIVLGNDDHIDLLREEIENPKLISEPENLLEELELKGFYLEKNNSFIGKTIQVFLSQQHLHVLVVGLERNTTRKLNPNPNMLLETGDLLFLVGERKYLDQLE